MAEPPLDGSVGSGVGGVGGQGGPVAATVAGRRGHSQVSGGLGRMNRMSEGTNVVTSVRFQVSFMAATRLPLCSTMAFSISFQSGSLMSMPRSLMISAKMAWTGRRRSCSASSSTVGRLARMEAGSSSRGGTGGLAARGLRGTDADADAGGGTRRPWRCEEVGEPGLKHGGEPEAAGDPGEDEGDVEGAVAPSDVADGLGGGVAAQGYGEFLAEDDEGTDDAEQADGARGRGVPILRGIGVSGWLGGGCRGGHGRQECPMLVIMSRYFFLLS